MSRAKPTFTRHARGGYMLLLMAMLLFAFFGVAALVIDLGMVRLTQLQMQSAADSAALEGLRFRDEIPAAWWTQYQSMVETAAGRSLDPTSAQDRDAIRRWAASYLVANIFDDDMNPNDVDTSGDLGQPGNWGAGPVLDLSGPGLGSNPALAAGQLLQAPPPGQRAYKPSLQENLSNEPYGDLVSGTYGANSSFTGTYPYLEDSQYNRADFTPAAEPSGSEPAFVARLRRTNDLQGLDNQSGISSAGPTLPFLFGRGSTIQQSPGSAYAPRQQGLTVRGTGLASAQPAVSVGPAISGPVSVAGLLNVAVTQGFWETINAGNTAAYPPVLQIEPTDNQQTTIAVDGPAAGGISALPANVSFMIQVDRELMQVTAATSSGSGAQSWTVQRAQGNTQAAAHASPASARLIPSLNANASGNLLDTPIVATSSTTTAINLVAANRLASFGSAGGANTVFAENLSINNALPVLVCDLQIGPISINVSAATLVPAVAPATGQWLQLNSSTTPQPLSAGSVVELVLPAAGHTIEPGATQIVVTAPAAFNVPQTGNVWYFDNPAEPALGEILLIHDASLALDPNAEYVRLTGVTPPESASSFQYTLTVERGLFGTAGNSHTGAAIAITPLAGCGFGATTLSTAIGTSDQAISVATGQSAGAGGSGFPLREPAANSTQPLFLIQIDQEVLGVMGPANGTTGTNWSPRSWNLNNPMPASWNVERGASGTIPAAHSASAPVVYCDALSYGDPIQLSPQQTIPTQALGGLPIVDDFGSTLNAAICGFGRAMVSADPSTGGTNINYLIMAWPGANAVDPTSGTAAANAAGSFVRPFAADLAPSDSQPTPALQATLWQTMMEQLVDPSNVRLPRNPLLAPVLMSTNVPPSVASP